MHEEWPMRAVIERHDAERQVWRSYAEMYDVFAAERWIEAQVDPSEWRVRARQRRDVADLTATQQT